MVYAASQLLYDFIFKGTSLDQVLTSIGSSGTPSSGA
jgi:hypothetical protein